MGHLPTVDRGSLTFGFKTRRVFVKEGLARSRPLTRDALAELHGLLWKEGRHNPHNVRHTGSEYVTELAAWRTKITRLRQGR